MHHNYQEAGMAAKRRKKIQLLYYYRRESSPAATIFRSAAVPAAASSDRKGTRDRIETRRRSHDTAPEDGRTPFGSGWAALGFLCLFVAQDFCVQSHSLISTMVNRGFQAAVIDQALARRVQVFSRWLPSRLEGGLQAASPSAPSRGPELSQGALDVPRGSGVSAALLSLLLPPR